MIQKIVDRTISQIKALGFVVAVVVWTTCSHCGCRWRKHKSFVHTLLRVSFVDLCKAYDSVNYKAL